MVSDNGRTFKAAAKLLSDIVAHPEVEQSYPVELQLGKGTMVGRYFQEDGEVSQKMSTENN